MLSGDRRVPAPRNARWLNGHCSLLSSSGSARSLILRARVCLRSASLCSQAACCCVRPELRFIGQGGAFAGRCHWQAHAFALFYNRVCRRGSHSGHQHRRDPSLTDLRSELNDILAHAQDLQPWGSGLGTYEHIYRFTSRSVCSCRPTSTRRITIGCSFRLKPGPSAFWLCSSRFVWVLIVLSG